VGVRTDLNCDPSVKWSKCGNKFKYTAKTCDGSVPVSQFRCVNN
jgi:hypothetical protein